MKIKRTFPVTVRQSFQIGITDIFRLLRMPTTSCHCKLTLHTTSQVRKSFVSSLVVVDSIVSSISQSEADVSL